MKLFIDERNIRIDEVENLYTGNIKTYEIEVIYEDPELFRDLACCLVFNNNNVSRKVIIGPNNKIFIPHEVLENQGDLSIGFFAFTKKENGELIRYSSEIEILYVEEGAYDRVSSYSEELTPTILENYQIAMNELYNRYITEMQEIYYNSNNLNEETKELKESIEESERNAKESEENSKESENNAKEYYEQIKDIAQAVPYANFEIDESTGELYINSPERFGNMGFEINDKGELEVEI